MLSQNLSSGGGDLFTLRDGSVTTGSADQLRCGLKCQFVSSSDDNSPKEDNIHDDEL